MEKGECAGSFGTEEYMPATIRDIKNKTGLSLATISKYLNGGNVLPRNRQLIEAAIEELHYEVNEIARGLVTNQTKLVGVMVYDIESLFVGNMLHYIGAELRRHGYGFLICDSFNDEEVETQNLQFLLKKKVDGLLVIPVNRSGKFMEPAKKVGVPVVLLDRAFYDEEFDFVGIDNRMAAYRAVKVLIENGHERIAVITSNVEYSGIYRLEGYLEAMKEAGLSVPEEYRRLGKHSFELGYKNMKELLALQERPTAVFLGNYETTLGGIMAVNESELSWPKDISIFGFDDLIMSRVVRPKIWIARQPMEQMCAKAVDILMERIGSKQTPEEQIMKVTFGIQLREGESIRRLNGRENPSGD